jgi:hypothetical protein
MEGFISFKTELEMLFSTIINSEELHVKWLNTLSYLENCGARKIAAFEHPTLVKEEILKHAAEEFRHAHHLKRQIRRISDHVPLSYQKNSILGGIASLHYLRALDLQTSRYLKSHGYSSKNIKEAAYLLVTYAIEMRAAELYPLYESSLRAHKARVTVKSILLEEEQHLAEITNGLISLNEGETHAKAVCAIESRLCKDWLRQIKFDLHTYEKPSSRIPPE